MPSGTLTVIGSGIKLAAHLTVETEARLRHSDRVFYLIPSLAAAEWIRQFNSEVVDLSGFYGKGKPRLATYLEMVEAILAPVREGQRVGAVFYGHPGVFVLPAHEALRRARKEGFHAEMLPGISAEDCLFADLGVDPAQNGCQSYEATDFLVRPRRFDPTTALVLWQIGVIGNITVFEPGKVAPGLAILKETLEAVYGAAHAVTVYEAAQYPGFDPLIQRAPLARLLEARVSPISTLYVPPVAPPAVNLDMLERLGLSPEQLSRETFFQDSPPE